MKKRAINYKIAIIILAILFLLCGLLVTLQNPKKQLKEEFAKDYKYVVNEPTDPDAYDKIFNFEIFTYYVIFDVGFTFVLLFWVDCLTTGEEIRDTLVLIANNKNKKD